MVTIASNLHSYSRRFGQTGDKKKRLLLPVYVLIFLVIFFHSGLFPPTACSHEYPFRYYDDPNMLSGMIWGSMQDSRGVLWFWGENGIMSYDGTRFRQFSIDDGLLDNYTYFVKEGPDHKLYIGTFRGLSILDPVNFSIAAFPERIGSPARDIEFTPDGMILAHDHGASLFRNRGEYLVPIRSVDPTPLTPDLANHIAYVAGSNTLWIAMSPKGLYSVDIEKFVELTRLQSEELSREYEAKGEKAFLEAHPDIESVDQVRAISDSTILLEGYRQAFHHHRPAGKPEDWIASNIHLDSSGTLWAARNGELFYWDDQQFVQHDISLPVQESQKPDIYFDHYNIYASYPSALLIMHDRQKRLLKPGMVSQHDEQPTFFLTDHQGTLWLSWENSNLAKLVSDEMFLYSGSTHPELQSVKKVFRFNDGTTWLAGPNGIVEMDGEEFTTVLSPSRMPDLTWDWAVDANGNILILTELGMYLYHHNSGQLQTLKKNIRHGANHHYAVAGQDGLLSFIANDSVFTWNGRTLTNTWNQFQHSTFLFPDPDGSLWVGTWNGPAKLKDGHAWHFLGHIYRYASDFSKRNWENIHVYPKNLFSNGFTALNCTIGPDSAYWFGTFASGIVRLKGDSIRVFDAKDGIPHVRYESVYRTPWDDLVFYSNNMAVRVSENSVTRIETSLSPNTVILDWLEDRPGRVFIATSQGLYIQSDSLNMLLDEDNGFLDNRVDRLEMLENGYILAVQEDGIIRFHPDSLYQTGYTQLTPFIAGVHTETGYQPVDGNMVLPKGERALQIELAFPDYLNESQHRYFWRLEPFDAAQKWRSNGTVASYENLDPGAYTFSLEVENSLGNRLAMQSPLRLTIPPYFYETIWFKALAGFLILGFFFLVYRWRVYRIERQKQLLQQLVKEKTAEALANQQRAMQAEIETKQLETATQLAATIAHEFNNPLAVIKGCTDLLRMGIVPEEQVEEHYNRVTRHIKRMSDLVDKLLRIRSLKEIDYAEGMKILDIHAMDTQDKQDKNTGQ